MTAVVVLCNDVESSQIHARISLAYSIDHWWYNSKGTCNIQVTPEIPLYLAIYIKDRFHEKLMSVNDLTWEVNDLHRLANEWIAEMFRSPDEAWHKHLDSLWNKVSRRANTSVVPEWSSEVLQEDAMRILPYIEGRRWLFEHLEKRLAMIGLRLSGNGYNENRMRRAYLHLLIQFLYLNEEIEITSGVTFNDTNGKLQVKCERCGSSDYGIHLHYCSICEHEDLVCDTCFVMGVSKGCSIVISRPKQSDYTREADHGPFLQEVAAGVYSQKRWNGEL